MNDMRMLRQWTWILLLIPGMAMAALFGNLFAGKPPAGIGVLDSALAPCPETPNCVVSRGADAQHAIAPIAFRGPADAAMEKLVRVVSAQPGATIVTQRADYLYATFQTPVMGFVDDVEFLVLPADNIIETRSASRVGHSDLGTNRARIEALRQAFEAAS